MRNTNTHIWEIGRELWNAAGVAKVLCCHFQICQQQPTSYQAFKGWCTGRIYKQLDAINAVFVTQVATPIMWRSLANVRFVPLEKTFSLPVVSKTMYLDERVQSLGEWRCEYERVSGWMLTCNVREVKRDWKGAAQRGSICRLWEGTQSFLFHTRTAWLTILKLKC